MICNYIQQKGAKSCADSAVCLTDRNDADGSYGKSEQGTFRKNVYTLDLEFTGGKKCGNTDKLATSTIHFNCDTTAGNGRPVVAYEGTCHGNKFVL